MSATRVCKGCGEAKPETDEFFDRHKSHRGGLNMRCKACRGVAAARRREADPEAARAKQREIQARYRARHPEKIKAEAKAHNARYRRENKAKLVEAATRWRKANPEKAAASVRNWQRANREHVAQLHRDWAAANPDKVAEKSLRWRKANPDKLRARDAAWRKANPEKYRAKRARQHARMMAAAGPRVIGHRMSGLVRYSIRRCMEGGDKAFRRWRDLVGYDVHALMAHIERQFTKGMTWQNWGSFWHLDHIQPIASFRFTSLDCPEFRACWALSNLRPLPAKENIIKGAKRVFLL